MSIYAHLRKWEPTENATPRSRLWFAALPHPVRPTRLLSQYPRVVNRVAEAWDNPAVFGELSTDLLYDFRGNRAGFPAEIVCELQALREYYYQRPSQRRR